MGRNAAIRRHQVHPEGQPLDLFEGAEGRLPVVLEILRSPWVFRASELGGEDASAPKRFEKPVEVEWDGERRTPVLFVLHGRRYRVDALLQRWNVERRWWRSKDRISRRCFRVLARGGVYDLAYDRVSGRWLLIGIVD
ncbi:MAG: hypothetical protein Kow0056_03000 [Coriobacteriia bacterium]